MNWLTNTFLHPAIIGVFIGFCLSFIPSYLEKRSKRKSLSVAIRRELEFIKDTMEKNIDTMNKVIDGRRAGSEDIMESLGEYCTPVTNSCIPQITLLNQMAVEKIIELKLRFEGQNRLDEWIYERMKKSYISNEEVISLLEAQKGSTSKLLDKIDATLKHVQEEKRDLTEFIFRRFILNSKRHSIVDNYKSIIEMQKSIVNDYKSMIDALKDTREKRIVEEPKEEELKEGA